MNAHTARDVDFEALKDAARLAWLLNFEAIASVPPHDDGAHDPRR